MCGKRTRQRRAPDVTIFVHGVQDPAACPNRTMSRIMLSVLSDCGEVGQQSKLMTSLGAWNGKNILEDERTWAKGRQASMPATRPSKRDHSTNIAAHGLDCSPTRPGSWEPDLRGFDAQWRDQLKMDSGCWASKGSSSATRNTGAESFFLDAAVARVRGSRKSAFCRRGPRGTAQR
jgi:hypothetical protein